MDVWLHIVQQIPEGELDRLLSLNSLFFHTVMKNRYRRVQISDSPKEVKRVMALLRRLSYVTKIFQFGAIYNFITSDPFVGGLVESLSLCFEFRFNPGCPQAGPPNISFMERVNVAISRAIGRRLTGSPTSPNSDRVSLDDVKIVFPSLPNVTEFAMCLYGYLDCAPFFSNAWGSFGTKLHKCSLGGNLETIRRILVPKPDFQSLEELSMMLGQRSDESAVQGLSVVQDVIPVLNSLAPRPQLFRLWFWTTFFNLSSVLKQLGPFPNLVCLSLQGKFNNGFQNGGSSIPGLLSQMPKTSTPGTSTGVGSRC